MREVHARNFCPVVRVDFLSEHLRQEDKEQLTYLRFHLFLFERNMQNAVGSGECAALVLPKRRRGRLRFSLVVSKLFYTVLWFIHC